MARIRPTVLALVELELWPNLILRREAFGRGGGDRQRPAEPPEPPRLPAAPGATRADPAADRRGGRPDRGVCRPVRRPGRPARPRPGDRIGQVRRPGDRPEQRADPRLARGVRAVARRPRLRRGEHDGGRGGRRPGGLPGGAAGAPEAPPGDRASPRRAVREGGGVAARRRARSVVRRSLPDVPVWRGEPPPVILVDTMGELSAVWGLADVAFVGGAWSPDGAGRT